MILRKKRSIIKLLEWSISTYGYCNQRMEANVCGVREVSPCQAPRFWVALANLYTRFWKIKPCKMLILRINERMITSNSNWVKPARLISDCECICRLSTVDHVTCLDRRTSSMRSSTLPPQSSPELGSTPLRVVETSISIIEKSLTTEVIH